MGFQISLHVNNNLLIRGGGEIADYFKLGLKISTHGKASIQITIGGLLSKIKYFSKIKTKIKIGSESCVSVLCIYTKNRVPNRDRYSIIQFLQIFTIYL